MSEPSIIKSGLERALDGYAKLLTEQNAQTNVKIERLTKVVEKLSDGLSQLAREHMRTEERHERNVERFERIENNSKDQGAKLDGIGKIADGLLKDAEYTAKRRAFWSKIASSVVATVAVAVVWFLLIGITK